MRVRGIERGGGLVDVDPVLQRQDHVVSADAVAVRILLVEDEVVFRIGHHRAQLRQHRQRRVAQGVERLHVDPAVLVHDLRVEAAVEGTEGVAHRPRLSWRRRKRARVAAWGLLEPDDVAGQQRAERVGVDGHDLPEPDAEIVRAGGSRSARLSGSGPPGRSAENGSGDSAGDLAAELIDLLLEVEKQAGEVHGRLRQILGSRLVAQVLRQLQRDARAVAEVHPDGREDGDGGEDQDQRDAAVLDGSGAHLRSPAAWREECGPASTRSAPFPARRAR